MSYGSEGNGLAIEAVQPVPGGTITLSLEDTTWRKIVIPAGAVLVEIAATGSCLYVVTHPTYAPGADEAPLDTTTIRRDGITKHQVVHVKAVTATTADPIIVRVTPQRTPVR